MFIIAQTVIMCHCHSEVKAIRVCLKTADHCRLPQITTDQPNFRFKCPQITVIYKYRTEDHHRSTRAYTYREWWSVVRRVICGSVVLLYYRCNSDLRINVKLCFRATRQELSEVLDLQLEWCAFHTSSLWSYKRQQWSGT